MKNTKFWKNQQGNLLLEAMLGLALASVGFLVYYEIEHHIEDRKQFSKVTSNMYQQYNVFLTALNKYALTSNTTQLVSCQQLKSGYLAQDFNCTDYLGDTLEGILVKNQTQTAYVVGVPSTNSQNMLNSYDVSSAQVLNQALAQSQPDNSTNEFFLINVNNYVGYPVTNISQTMNFSEIADYLPQQGLNLNKNQYVIALVGPQMLNQLVHPQCTSSSSILNPPGTWTYSFTNKSAISYLNTVSITECSYTEWQPYESCTYANGQTYTVNDGPPFSTSSCTADAGQCPQGYVWNSHYNTCVNKTRYTTACYPPYYDATTTGPTSIVTCAYWTGCPQGTVVDPNNNYICVTAPDSKYECPSGYTFDSSNLSCVLNYYVKCPDYNIYKKLLSSGWSCSYDNWCTLNCNNNGIVYSSGYYIPSHGTAVTDPSSSYYGYYLPATSATLVASSITPVQMPNNCPVDSTSHQGYRLTPNSPVCIDYGFFTSTVTPLSCPFGMYPDPNTGTCQY